MEMVETAVLFLPHAHWEVTLLHSRPAPRRQLAGARKMKVCSCSSPSPCLLSLRGLWAASLTDMMYDLGAADTHSCSAGAVRRLPVGITQVLGPLNCCSLLRTPEFKLIRVELSTQGSAAFLYELSWRALVGPARSDMYMLFFVWKGCMWHVGTSAHHVLSISRSLGQEPVQRRTTYVCRHHILAEGSCTREGLPKSRALDRSKTL